VLIDTATKRHLLKKIISRWRAIWMMNRTRNQEISFLRGFELDATIMINSITDSKEAA
jgi:hypothetical protein